MSQGRIFSPLSAVRLKTFREKIYAEREVHKNVISIKA